MTYKGYAKAFTLEGGAPALSLDPKDRSVWLKVLDEAIKKGKRVAVTAFVERKDRTDGQLRLYWKVLTILFSAVNGTRPTEEEKLVFHEEIKEIYSNRKASVLRPGVTIPIGFKDGDTQDASVLIEGVFLELSQASLEETSQMEARGYLQEYWAMGGQRYKDEEDFRARARLCAACTRGGIIQKAHMESRGANHARIDDPDNWIPLCPDCHGKQHQHGAEVFLREFPHLETRWRERPVK